MTTLKKKTVDSLAVSVSFGKDTFSVALKDGRQLSVPYTWYPRLIGASKKQLEKYELSRNGIHWIDLDEDISVEGLIRGIPDQTNFARRYWQEHPEQKPTHDAD
jgi:hypothetical protein